MLKRKSGIMIILFLLILIFGLSVTASAENVNSGIFSADLIWSLDGEGLFTISGTGPMDDFSVSGDVPCISPWYDLCDQITDLIIENGVTSIGEYAFSGCSSMLSATIPNSVTRIGRNAFENCQAITDIYFDGSEEEWKEAAYLEDIGLHESAAVHFAHIHEYIETTVDPTCTEQGFTYYFCPCGESYTVMIPPAGHKEVIIEGKPATCLECGLTDGAVCKVCGETLTEQEEIPISDHAWDAGAVVKYPSFTEEGEMTNTCTVCGITRTEILEKLIYLDTPEITSIYNTSNGVTLKWNKVKNASQYRVFRKNEKGVWTILGNTAYNSFSVTGLTAGTRYTFTVRCTDPFGKTYTSSFNAEGKSIYYNPISGKTRIYLSPSDQTENAYAYGDTTEALQCYRIADALEIALRRCGFDVINNQINTMEERVDESNDWRAALHLPLHTNAYNHSVSGTRMFTDSLEGEDYKCAECIFKYLAPLSPGPSDNITTNNTLYEINHPTALRVYIESEFHDIPEKAEWIIEHTTDIAEAICHGVCDYYGVKYVTNLPIILTAKGNFDGVQVTWNTVKGAEQYRVFKKVAGRWTALGDTAETTFTDTTAVTGNTYTYTVRCVSADGQKYTSSFDAGGKTIKYNVTPELNVENTADSVKVTWDAVNNVENYRVFKKVNGKWTALGDTDETTFFDTTAETNTSYTYTVRCTSADGSTYISSFNSAGKTIKFMATPLFTTESTDDGVQITWDPVNGAENYRIFKKIAGKWTALCDTSGTTFTDTTAITGNTYVYTVRCLSEDGKRYISNFDAVNGKIRFMVTPVFEVENTGDGVLVTWDGVKGAENYRVFKKVAGRWTALGDTTGTSFVDTTAVSGETYIYTVRCTNAAGTVYTSNFNSGGKTITH